jgi:CheY-like chemotaxis protein
MQNRLTTSWRRLSDNVRPYTGDASTDGTQTPRFNDKQREQLNAWEDEGGSTAVATSATRILIVDNDMNSADALEDLLHAAGQSETRVAYSAHAALAIAAEYMPDLVLLAPALPDMGGYALAQSLRENAQTQTLRLIALTSSPEHAGRELARFAGFERYLLKPVTAASLSDLLEMPAR